MIKFNVYGGEGKVPTGTYTDHRHGSTRYDVSGLIKNIEWCFDNSGEINFYIDEKIPLSLQHDTKIKKYGWLLESKGIIPEVYDDFLSNIDAYMNIFDLFFTSDKKLYSAHERIKFVPANTTWVKDFCIPEKTKLISMITSNNSQTIGHKIRNQLANQLIHSVDIYGRGINPINIKEDGLRDYMFSFAIENSSYSSYFTEKILDCFAMGTVPIYWGSPDIGDFFNTDGIILLNDLSDIKQLTPELYYSKINAIVDNFERSKKYFLLENYIYDNYLGEM